MPLHAGSSKATFDSNVREIMTSYGKSGSIGTSHPKSKKKAIKQALAIAYSKQRETLAHGK